MSNEKKLIIFTEIRNELINSCSVGKDLMLAFKDNLSLQDIYDINLCIDRLDRLIFGCTCIISNEISILKRTNSDFCEKCYSHPHGEIYVKCQCACHEDKKS